MASKFGPNKELEANVNFHLKDPQGPDKNIQVEESVKTHCVICKLREKKPGIKRNI